PAGKRERKQRILPSWDDCTAASRARNQQNTQTSVSGSEFLASALAGLEPALGLVDDVDAAFAPHQPIVAVPAAQGFERIADFHRWFLGARGLIGATPKPVNAVSCGYRCVAVSAANALPSPRVREEGKRGLESNPQIRLAHAVVGQELRPGSLEHGATGFHDIGPVGDAERRMGVLLDQEDRDAFLLQLLHAAENL